MCDAQVRSNGLLRPSCGRKVVLYEGLNQGLIPVERITDRWVPNIGA